MTLPKNLYFLGDSLVEYFAWQGFFPGHNVFNFGLAGDTTTGLHGRLCTLAAANFSPDIVILMIGSNDLLADHAFLTAYEALVTTMRTAWPHAVILINALMPMPLAWLDKETIPAVNGQLEELALRHKIGYLDVGSLLHNCEFPPCFLEDGVHLSPHGYTLWGAAIAAHLHQFGCLD